MSDALQVVKDDAGLDIDFVVARRNKIIELMQRVLKEGTHYGGIPGVDRPCLLKAGAEALGLVFGFVPKFIVKEKDLPGDHREYTITSQIYSRKTGELIAEGLGLCSTMESKYRWRKQYLTEDVGAVPSSYWEVPRDDLNARNKALEDVFGSGKYRTKKTDSGWRVMKITGDADRSENSDISDVLNTVLKMGKKRAYIDAIITACGVSDIFSQDLDEEVDGELSGGKAKHPQKPTANEQPTETLQNEKPAAKTPRDFIAADCVEDYDKLMKRAEDVVKAGFITEADTANLRAKIKATHKVDPKCEKLKAVIEEYETLSSRIEASFAEPSDKDLD